MLGRVKVVEAAEILEVSPQFVRVAMQQKALPIGTAIRISKKNWTYHVSPKLLEEYSGKDIEEAVNQIRLDNQTR